MAVRRLAAEQPESFAFTPANMEWARQRIALYPEGKQASAVIPILWRAQEQEGWVTEPAIRAVAEMLDMPYIRVLEVATFYTQFQLAPVGTKAHIQVCGTTPCMLRGANDLIEVCRHKIHHDPFHVTENGALSWEEVECLGACVNAPMVMVGKDTYEDLTPESFSALIDGFATGNPPKPGPQIDRHQSSPVGGARVLTDPSLYDGSMVGQGAGLQAARDAIAARLAAEEAAKAEAAAPAAEQPAAAPPPASPAAAAPAVPPPAVPPSKADAPAAPPAAEPVVVAGEADKERVPDTFKPPLFTAAREGGPDDLKLIHGIGPRLETLLQSLGVYHFDQIAAWSSDNLRWVDQHLDNFRGRALRDQWIEQAQRLMTGWRPSNPKGDAPN